MKTLPVILASALVSGCDARPKEPPAPAPASPGATSAAPPTPAPNAATAPAKPAAGDAEIVDVKIAGKTFHLELAADEPMRVKGLGGRESLPDDGGMIFVFPEPLGLAFVMRDCVIPIDIAFLDASGRVVAVHTMKVEPARRADESAEAYERRLPRYESRFAAQFAVEVPAGTLEKLGVKSGDVVKFDAPGLKRRVR